MKCIKCDLKFVNNGSLKKHEKSCNLTKDKINDLIFDYKDGISILKLSLKYKCSKSIVIRLIIDIKRNLSEAIKIAHEKYPNSFKHTESSKQKIREARLKFMKENPDKTAWRKANLSYPEKLFLNKITELKWHEKYLIIREKSCYPYFIDFAFDYQKIAIEIDGKQHENEDRKLSDNKKDNLLNELGWIVIRFTANKIKYEIDDCIKIIEIYLKDKDSEVGVYSYSEIKKIKKESVKNKNKFGFSDKQRDNQLKQRSIKRPSLNQLSKDISELGFSKTGVKYNVSCNSIRNWMKMYEKYGDEF